MPEQLLTPPSLYPLGVEPVPEAVLREGRYEVRFARSEEELEAVLRLRFEVFNLELGEGLDESFATGLDRDPFDAVCHHLIVADLQTSQIVGTYRMQTGEMAARNVGFYSAAEFDLTDLPAEVIADSVEVGRACVAASHRNTQVLFLLWRGLAVYMATHRKRYLFGCCSLTSQNPYEGLAVMQYLEAHRHVHPTLRVDPQPGYECYSPDLEPDPTIEAKIPKLFRIYLRHGAKACGVPAIDRLFKTIDYLVIFDVAAMEERQVRTFFGESRSAAPSVDGGFS